MARRELRPRLRREPSTAARSARCRTRWTRSAPTSASARRSTSVRARTRSPSPTRTRASPRERRHRALHLARRRSRSRRPYVERAHGHGRAPRRRGRCAGAPSTGWRSSRPACARRRATCNIDTVVLRCAPPMDALTINEAAARPAGRRGCFATSSGPGCSCCAARPAATACTARSSCSVCGRCASCSTASASASRELGFARRLRTRAATLRRAVEDWFETEPARPAVVAPDDWLRWEQEKHQALLAAATTTYQLETA